MLLKRFYDDRLAQASYLVGCQAMGEAVVIDANRDVDAYIRAAEAEGLRITAVTETHIHADYVSGSRELAKRTGATLYLSDEGDTDWKYAFAAEAGAVLLKDGYTFRVGNLELRALHTPGQTPEHLSFMLTDTRAADRPMGVFTGDFVFVGDIGRPDLLEKAAGVVGTMESGARRLFRSLQAFKTLPDYLQLWPAHGAGSACGKGIGGVPQTTLGYERFANWAFGIEDEDTFVREVLAGQPEPPRYFAEMKRINKVGPPILGGFRRPERLVAARLGALVTAGAVVVDTRPAAAFALGHVPGTLNLPLDASFTTWAGWLLPYDADLYLIADDGQIDDATRALATIGLDRVAGYFGPEAVPAWASGGRALATIPEVTAPELAEALRRGEVALIDVRGEHEYAAGRIPGARHLFLGDLTRRLDEVPRERPVVVQCRSGNRSAIAASLLRARGVERVVNLVGGLDAWQAAGLPVERPSLEPAAVPATR